MAAAPAEHNPPDRRPAYQARLCFTSVNAVLELEESFFSIGIDVIGDRRPAQGDRLTQNFLNSGVQFVQPLARNRRGSPSRTDASAKQRFIGVDVAHAAQKFLVQQRALDGSLASAKQFGELVRAHLQRFDTAGIEAAGFGLRMNAELAKHSGIDEAEFAS